MALGVDSPRRARPRAPVATKAPKRATKAAVKPEPSDDPSDDVVVGRPKAPRSSAATRCTLKGRRRRPDATEGDGGPTTATSSRSGRCRLHRKGDGATNLDPMAMYSECAIRVDPRGDARPRDPFLKTTRPSPRACDVEPAARRKIAYEYRRLQEHHDLVQEGNIGLMQAVKRYDPYRGVKPRRTPPGGSARTSCASSQQLAPREARRRRPSGSSSSTSARRRTSSSRWASTVPRRSRSG